MEENFWMCVKFRNSFCAIRSNYTLRKYFQLEQQKGVFLGGKFSDVRSHFATRVSVLINELQLKDQVAVNVTC